jgi:hypothetical protein
MPQVAIAPKYSLNGNIYELLALKIPEGRKALAINCPNANKIDLCL